MSALGATDIFLGNQGGVTGTATAAQISTYVRSTFTAPPTIGSVTPAAGAFTTLTSSSGMPLSSLATQATNTVAGNATSGTAVPTALAVGTCSTAGSALKWTTNTGFGCNTAIDAATSTGVTDASNGTAGKVGEVASINCLVAGSAAASTSVTVTIATPGVVTWSSHTFAPSTGLANYTCPINFLGTPPTGIVVGTNYYIIGSSVSGDTFQISDTAAHALAGTNAVATTGSDGGTTAFIGALGSTGTVFGGAALNLTAGDWDCSFVGTFEELTSLTTTRFTAGIHTSVGAPTTGNANVQPTASQVIGAASPNLPSPIVRENVSATTAIYGVDISTFSGGTMNEGGLLRCRRMR